MRGSKAKNLRRFAEHRTTGKPGVAYKPLKAKRVTQKDHILVPGVQVPNAIWLGQLELVVDCTRAVYQRYKSMYKAAPSYSRVMK